MGFSHARIYSEFRYYGDATQEFVEVALPAGTDPAGYSVYFYNNDGEVLYSFPLGSSTGTMDGHDVYVIDDTTPGFDDSATNSTGRMFMDDALALVDDNGDVVQFVSYWDNTVEGDEGPANGQTSTDVGTSDPNGSLQSDDGGSTYYAQNSPNSGSIPACYAPGTLIATPDGFTPVESLVAGDVVTIKDGRTSIIQWVWSGDQPLDDVAPDQKPVLIRQGALGTNLPNADLIVSGNHRIIVGGYGQLEHLFGEPKMVPAKTLTELPGIRLMAGKRSITWHHVLCDEHQVIFANGLASETLLLGVMVLKSLSPGQLAEVSQVLGRPISKTMSDQPVLPCLKVKETRQILKQGRRMGKVPKTRNPVGSIGPKTNEISASI